MAMTYFLVVDPNKNTIKVPADKALAFISKLNISDVNIISHKTKRELNNELIRYFDGGWKNEK